MMTVDIIRSYVKNNTETMYQLLKELCGITAPSLDEGRRAEFCKAWFDKEGFEGAYVDEALNVILPINCEGSNAITALVAHTDTVFGDIEPFEYREEDDLAFCPGIGDDTACLVAMMLTAKFFKENGIRPEGGILFIANSGEEGLGNLKGTRRIFKDYEGRIAQFVSFDSNTDIIIDRCVGSHRYEVTAITRGGHSYNDFGNDNAIAVLSGIVTDIYSLKLPDTKRSTLTYNVGVIEGGTSVNTIAEMAKMLCEYRSDNADLLDYMKGEFNRIFEKYNKDGVDISVRVVGERPCERGVDATRVAKMRDIATDLIEEILGESPKYETGSTDCNIPLSIGVPAICVGTFIGGGMHKRGEWLRKSSMIPGLEFAIRYMLSVTGALK